VCADRVGVDVHPQTLKVESASVACHVAFDPHCRCVANPVMLGAERSTDISPVGANLIRTPIHLVVMRGVGQDGIVGVEDHHQIEILRR
jgi:hypothetical protein